jgi:beta-galactosidase GanA
MCTSSLLATVFIIMMTITLTVAEPIWYEKGLDHIQVKFDGRSFLINSKRVLFMSGSIHYPRAPRSEWRTIMEAAKDNGINVLQTYVFWDIHEPQNNQWYFPSDDTSNEDLVAFIQLAADMGLFVHLRIAGYICAEWSFGIHFIIDALFHVKSNLLIRNNSFRRRYANVDKVSEYYLTVQ